MHMANFQWILQSNLTNPENLKEIESVLKDENIPFQEARIIPFSDELPELSNKNFFPIFYGSSTLMLNAYKHPLYCKGVFYNENFAMSNYLDRWGNKMLNDDARIFTFEEFVNRGLNPVSEWFIRPNSDNKSFSGMTMDFEEIEELFGTINQA